MLLGKPVDVKILDILSSPGGHLFRKICSFHRSHILYVVSVSIHSSHIDRSALLFLKKETLKKYKWQVYQRVKETVRKDNKHVYIDSNEKTTDLISCLLTGQSKRKKKLELIETALWTPLNISWNFEFTVALGKRQSFETL